MQSLLADYASSQLTVANFYRLHDLSVATFYYWKKKLATSDLSTEDAGFISMAAAGPGAVKLTLPGGLRAELSGSTTEQLAQLLYILDARHRG